MTKKICFLICPIDKEGSPERKRADQLYNHIMMEVLKDYDFEVIRADKIGKPGIITLQIIEQLNSADLVIADLKGHNPNVFYELGIRHVIGKPVIQIFHPEERIPFDISGLRSIPLDIQDLDSVKGCIQELKHQISTILKKPEEVTSPYSAAIDYQILRSSDNPVAKGIADIKESMESLRTEIAESNDYLKMRKQSDSFKTYTLSPESIESMTKFWDLIKEYTRKKERAKYLLDFMTPVNNEKKDNKGNNTS